jgi:hypothetical protein
MKLIKAAGLGFDRSFRYSIAFAPRTMAKMLLEPIMRELMI